MKCEDRERGVVRRQAEKIRRQETKQVQNEKQSRTRANKKRKTYVIDKVSSTNIDYILIISVFAPNVFFLTTCMVTNPMYSYGTSVLLQKLIFAWHYLVLPLTNCVATYLQEPNFSHDSGGG